MMTLVIQIYHSRTLDQFLNMHFYDFENLLLLSPLRHRIGVGLVFCLVLSMGRPARLTTGESKS